MSLVLKILWDSADKIRQMRNKLRKLCKFQCPTELKQKGTFGNFMSNGAKTQPWQNTVGYA